MNTPTWSKPLIAAVALAAVVLPVSNAEALLIDFDAYTPGNLSGQPAGGTQWSGGGGDFVVTSGAGFGGSQAVVTQTRASSTSSSLFSPSGTDLPGFNGSSSVLNVTFKFRYTQVPVGGTSTVAAVQFGFDGADGNTAIRFYLRSDGRLGYSNGEGAVLVGSDVVSITNTTTWVTVSATLNYATQKYQFSINDTPYVSGGGTSEFNFRGPSTSAAVRLVDHGSANFVGVAFDNIEITAVPEPSTAMLLFGAAAGGWALQRKLKR